MNTNKVIEEVKRLLPGDDGHGIDHVMRVRNMALAFATKEGANTQVVELAVLLHDVDDYKLFGEESAKNLTNAKTILENCEVDSNLRQDVIDIIKNMGYNKYLDGIRPDILEGMIVSDADMCDAIGAEGILRTHAYALSKGDSFYDDSLLPEDAVAIAATYRAEKKSHSVQHFFDKLLIIPSIMMTTAGKEEAAKREKIMVDFLEELFRENESTEWQEHLRYYQANK